jgi:hypothetical protein
MDACMHACKSRQRVEYSRIMISYNLDINNPRQENGFLNRCWFQFTFMCTLYVPTSTSTFTQENVQVVETQVCWR